MPAACGESDEEWRTAYVPFSILNSLTGVGKGTTQSCRKRAMAALAASPTFAARVNSRPFPCSTRILPWRPSRWRRRSRRDLSSDHVSGDDHLHPAIQFPARGSGVVGDRTRLAETACNHIVDRDVVIHQVVTHRGGPLF